ncbi:MAG: GNAT family N-acetyltransferase [Leptolyngbyaceae cyanobacterium]
MNASIISVHPEDQAEVLELMTRVICTSVTQDVNLQASYIKNVTQNLAWWAENPTLGCHLKAVNQQMIVGVVLIKNYWNLCSLFVAPDHHRQGIGRALVNAAIAECQGKSEKPAIRLNAAPNAMPFYKAIGFELRESQQPQPPGVKPMQFIFKRSPLQSRTENHR